jgi:outer membrane protein assembly factor BamB
MIGCAAPSAVIESRVAHRPPLRCPPPAPDALEPDSAPPWERDPLGRSPRGCVETDDGARVTLRNDPRDVDGWSEFLVVEEGAGQRFEHNIRAATAMAIAPDGGVVLAHTEDAVSRYAPTGALLWKTAHPRCGYPEMSVGYDGRVVLACGYSLVAFSPDGKFQWQKWPFGNQSVGRVLLAADGTMVARSGAIVAGLDTNGEIRWRLDTGWNRYVQPLGVQQDGTLVFRTTIAEAHTPGDVHVYYPYEPEELFSITRGGRVMSQRAIDSPPVWPPTLPWTVTFRSGRLP